MQLSASHLTYTHPGQSDPVFDDVCVSFPTGWSAVIGDNGIGKTTLARLLLGRLRPQSGDVTPAPGAFVTAYCAQRLDERPDGLDDFAADWSPEAMRVRRLLGIGDDWPYRFDTLSAGQAKRVQIACALTADPDVLVLDEPTNHVDAPTRRAIIEAMRAFRGVGIVISHDVALIDAVCDRCVSFERVHRHGRNVTVVTTRQGGYTQAHEDMAREYGASARELERARRETKRLHDVRRARMDDVAGAARAATKRIDARDHDARDARKLAKSTSLDGGVSRAAARIGARIERAGQAAARIRTAAKRYDGDFWVHGEPSHVDEVIHMRGGMLRPGRSTVEDAANLRDDETTSALTMHGTHWTIVAEGPDASAVSAIRIPSISVGPRDHITLTGDNGLGKTTLIEALRARCDPHVRALVIAQNTTDADAHAALERLRALPPSDRATVLSAYAQLNADPDDLLASGVPSPGELRKLLLALAVIDDIGLIIMDEPTNHLDVTSNEALARALAQYAGALIVVSHDERFLGLLTAQEA